MKRFVLLIACLSFSNLLFSSEITDFEKYKQSQKKVYQEYKSDIQKRFENYQKNISKEWKNIEVPNKYKWVEYSENYKERTIVDYEKENIKIQINVPKNEKKEVSQKKIMENMERMMSQYVQKASNKNPYIEENKTVKSNETMIGDIYHVDSKNKEEVKKISEKILKDENIKEIKAKNKDEKIVEITVPFPKEGLLIKAQKYKADVEKRAKEYKLDESLIFAVIHCESSYNPMATSSIPAYGLMQIVPKSAGKDAARRLYGKEKVLTPEYLYNGPNNIEVGANYLNLLYYNYLREIKNLESRKYCTIAAYNTGAGNVAKAFIGTTNISKAVIKINAMSSDDVYQRLIKNLPYNETKEYLKKVSSKENYYKKKLKEIK